MPDLQERYGVEFKFDQDDDLRDSSRTHQD